MPIKSFVEQEADGIIGIEGRQDAVVVGDVRDAGNRHDDEPERGDRSEEPGHGTGAVRLDDEQQDEDARRDRHDVGRQVGCDQLHAFDRRQNRQRRCNHRIAQEQRRARETEHKQHCGVPVCRLHQQSKQGERTAFAFVIGTQQQQDVFDRDDDRQRPKHQRDKADDLETGETIVGDRLQRFAECVERAGADIPVDDAH